MTLIGNLLIAISTLLYLILLTILFGKTPPKSGDAIIGYAWTVIILNLLFIASSLLTACIIGWKGGFSWVASSTAKRFVIVSLVLVSALITTALAGLFKYEVHDGSAFLRIATIVIPVLLPLLLLIVGFVLNNDSFRVSIPMALLKGLSVTIAIIGTSGVAVSAGIWVKDNNRNQQAIAASEAEQYDDNQQRMLKEIEDCDITKNSVFLYVFSDANQTSIVKEKAVAKIKSNPEWQEELVRRLENDWAPEAFNFLASNEVDSPALFKEALPKGIAIQAKLIRESIRRSSHPSHFYPGMFSWEVERVLRTTDRFWKYNFNVLPAIKELRVALDEPSEYKTIQFTILPIIDKWIKAHS